MSRLTLASLKKFVRDNREGLHIKVRSDFDAMTDCVQQNPNSTFRPVEADTFRSQEHTLGIRGAWLVLGSRDYFKAYEEEGFKGIEVYNCCGSFILATRA